MIRSKAQLNAISRAYAEKRIQTEDYQKRQERKQELKNERFAKALEMLQNAKCDDDIRKVIEFAKKYKLLHISKKHNLYIKTNRQSELITTNYNLL